LVSGPDSHRSSVAVELLLVRRWLCPLAEVLLEL
jgi:hypothetical protein